LHQNYSELIRDIPDFPEPGILFKDITPILSNARAYQQVIRDLATLYRGSSIDYVVAVEARGYFFGAPLAAELQLGFIPIRKSGKLPRETFQTKYNLEYGEATIEMHKDAVNPRSRVLLVDDVLATGGTIEAAINLINQAGASVVAVAVLIELTDLNGRLKIGSIPCDSLIKF
jgi:adenine phosphoribosyltransferase